MSEPRQFTFTIGGTMRDLSGHPETARPEPVRVVVAPGDDPPFEVDAMVVEDDTYFVLGADIEVREPTEHPIRVWTEVHETEPAALGSIRVREGRPLRLHAVVHDLSEDPTVKPDSVSTGLTEIFRLVEDHGIRTLGLPILGAVHGRLSAEFFVTSLRDALRARPSAALESIWVPCGVDGAKAFERLLEAETHC